MEPEVAVIVEKPPATPVARPELLIVAIEVAEELQFAVKVRSFVLPSW